MESFTGSILKVPNLTLDPISSRLNKLYLRLAVLLVFILAALEAAGCLAYT